MAEISEFGNKDANDVKLYSEVVPLESDGATSDAFIVRNEGKLYFLKRLKLKYQYNPQYLLAFSKEYETGKRLSHPNLVHYISISGQNNTDILVEYIKGQNIADFMKANPSYFYGRKNLYRFMAECLSCLQYLHENQVVHCDLKPENILITDVGHDVKIIDLGFSYTDCYDNTTGWTRSYAAPELLNHQQVDGRTDLYSFGRILRYMKNEDPKLPVKDRIIDRLCAEKKEDRYESAQQLLDEIEDKSAKSRWIVFFLFVLIIIIGIGIFFSTRDNMTPEEQFMADSLAQIESLDTAAHPGGIKPDDAGNGIYVVDYKGNLVLPDKWDKEYRAMSVAVITDSFSAKIALSDQSLHCEWGADCFEEILKYTEAGLPHNEPGRVKSDYTGFYNSYVFVERNNQQPDVALALATNYTFADSTRGYLPAYGEMYYVREHIAEIDHALEVCGGIPIYSQWYWTSSQDSSYNRAWAINMAHTNKDFVTFAQLRNSMSPEGKKYGAPRLHVRAFGWLRDNKCYHDWPDIPFAKIKKEK